MLLLASCKTVTVERNYNQTIKEQLDSLNKINKNYYYIQWIQNDSLKYLFVNYKKTNND